MNTYNKQRLEISELWFGSDLKNSNPNLVIQGTIQRGVLTFTIGVYSFNPISGNSKIDAIYKDIDYKTTKELLNH